MAFDVYYSPGAGAVAGLAKQGGTGQFNLKMRELAAAEQASKRAARAKQQEIIAQQAMFDRQQSAKLEMFELEKQAEMDRDKRYQEFLMQRDAAKAKQQGNLVELRYTAKQRADLEKLNQDEDYINQSDSMSPMQKKVAIDEINKRRQSIQKLPAPQQDSPFPQGQDIGQTWETPGGGLATRDNKGNVRLLVKPPTIDEYSKIYDSVVKSMTNEETGAEPDAEAVEAEVNRRLAAYRKFMGGQSGAPQQPPGAQPMSMSEVGQQMDNQTVPGEQAPPQAQAAPPAPPAERARQMISFSKEKRNQINRGMRDLRGKGKAGAEESKRLSNVKSALDNMQKDLEDIASGKSEKPIEAVLDKFRQESQGQAYRPPIFENMRTGAIEQAPAPGPEQTMTPQSNPEVDAFLQQIGNKQAAPATEVRQQAMPEIDAQIAHYKKQMAENKRIKEGPTKRVEQAQQETADAAVMVRYLEARKEAMRTGDPDAIGKAISAAYNTAISGKMSPEMRRKLDIIKAKYEDTKRK